MAKPVFWRLSIECIDRHSIESEKEVLIKFVGHDNISKMRSGNGLLIGDLDESKKFAIVEYVGVVSNIDIDASLLKVVIRRKSIVLRPHPSGVVHWKEKHSFKFDPVVSTRYLFESIFAEEFETSTWNIDFNYSARGDERPSPSQTNSPESDFFTSEATKSESLLLEESVRFEPGWLIKKRTQFPKGGFVYLLKINDYFKFQASRFLPSESQFFIVNLEQKLKIIHAAWFNDYRYAENDLQARFYENRFDGELLYLDANEIRKVKAIGEAVAEVQFGSEVRGKLR